MHFLHLLIFPPPSNLPTFICEGATFGTAFSTVVQTPTIEYKQKDKLGDPTEWLHRNDNYVPGRRGPRTVLSGPSIRTNGSFWTIYKNKRNIKHGMRRRNTIPYYR